MSSLQRLTRALNRLRTRRLTFTTDIPVLVICRDRVDPLRQLVTWLEEEGMTDIQLIDNDSASSELMEYFSRTPHSVVRLGRNVGHTSPWLPELTALRRGPFVVSDCDIIPDPEAHGAIEHFVDLLNRYRSIAKVGFGLHIDDLPTHYARRDEVVRWESQFWARQLADEVYMATLDTTFALHRPGTPYTLGPALRTGGRFMARHEPWYQDSADLTPDLTFFLSRASSSTTWTPDVGGGYGSPSA